MGQNLAKIWTAALAMVVGTSSLLLADPFPSITEARLVGTWAAQDGDTRHVITFLQAGAFKGKCYIKGEFSFDYEGTWKLNQDWPFHFQLPPESKGPGLEGPDVRFIYYTYTRCPGMKPGAKDIDCVYSSGAESMTIITLKGAWRHYKRVEDKGPP